jgi:hypothetical protein
MMNHRLSNRKMPTVEKGHWLHGFVAGWLLWLRGKSKAKITTSDLSRAEFKTSTQGLGIRFVEGIRDVFRFRWIRLAGKSGEAAEDQSENGGDIRHD